MPLFHIVVAYPVSYPCVIPVFHTCCMPALYLLRLNFIPVSYLHRTSALRKPPEAPAYAAAATTAARGVGMTRAEAIAAAAYMSYPRFIPLSHTHFHTLVSYLVSYPPFMSMPGNKHSRALCFNISLLMLANAPCTALCYSLRAFVWMSGSGLDFVPLV